MESESQIELLISGAGKELAELDPKCNALINRIKGLKESLVKQLPPAQKLDFDLHHVILKIRMI